MATNKQLLKRITELNGMLASTRRERDLAQNNFGYYFRKYLKSSGKTIKEAEDDWFRECRGRDSNGRTINI